MRCQVLAPNSDIRVTLLVLWWGNCNGFFSSVHDGENQKSEITVFIEEAIRSPMDGLMEAMN